MLLAVDIGNTNITLGVMDGEEVIGRFRMTTKTQKTSDEYGVFISTLLKRKNINISAIEGVIISSVVPNIMYSFVSGIKKYIEVEPMIVGPGIKTGINIKTESPRQVGADRIVDLVGAYYTYGGPAMVVDFGTATTFDVVTEEGAFTVGITSPGIKITANALWNMAAKLPEIEIALPESILATNTVTSMQAGLVYGYIGQVEYIVKRVQEEIGYNMQVIATGGLANIIFEETDVLDVYDRNLPFKGLKYIYDRNKK